MRSAALYCSRNLRPLCSQFHAAGHACRTHRSAVRGSFHPALSFRIFIVFCPVKLAAFNNDAADRSCLAVSPFCSEVCITISAPCSIGLQRYGVARVLSTIRGTPVSLEAPENCSKSRTVRAGFAREFQQKRVLSLAEQRPDIFLKRQAIRKCTGSRAFLRVVENRLKVPP